jgi:hypothetical protein
MAAKFHLAENAFALQLLFQRPYGLFTHKSPGLAGERLAQVAS